MNLSTHIGALELNDVVVRFGNGALEAAAQASGPGVTVKFPRGNCINDGLLEASLASNVHPTLPVLRGGHCVSDGVLEAAASTELGPSTMRRLANTMCVP